MIAARNTVAHHREHDPDSPVRWGPPHVSAVDAIHQRLHASGRGWDGLLFLAGQIGLDSAGRLVPGGIEAETRQALENLRAVLQRHGSSLDQVIKCTAILTDMREGAAMNRVYATFFADHLPARTAFGATALVLGARVELDCVARVSPG